MYSDSKEGLARRLNDALKLFVEGFPETPDGIKKLRDYLVKHKIDHTLGLEEITTTFPTPQAIQFTEQGTVTSGKGTLRVHRIGEFSYA